MTNEFQQKDHKQKTKSIKNSYKKRGKNWKLAVAVKIEKPQRVTQETKEHVKNLSENYHGSDGKSERVGRGENGSFRSLFWRMIITFIRNIARMSNKKTKLSSKYRMFKEERNNINTTWLVSKHEVGSPSKSRSIKTWGSWNDRKKCCCSEGKKESNWTNN